MTIVDTDWANIVQARHDAQVALSGARVEAAAILFSARLFAAEVRAEAMNIMDEAEELLDEAEEALIEAVDGREAAWAAAAREIASAEAHEAARASYERLIADLAS